MKRIFRTLLSLTMLSAVLLICVAADDLYSSKDDPLISLSYANDVLGPEIMTEVLKKIDADYVKKSDLEPTNPSGYSLLTMRQGQALMAKDICEVILTEGEATAVVTSATNIENGAGLIDTTTGSVVTNGEQLSANHAVVIPKPDGRGLRAASQIQILVRGEYNITG